MLTRSVFGVALAMVVTACGSSSASPAPDASVADADVDASVAVDARPDVDNGAPSTVYPAPHPPLPRLVNAASGKVLASPKVYLVFFPNNASETELVSFAQKTAASTYWSATTSEYGVGALSYAGKVDLTEAAPATIAQADVGAWVASKIQSGAFGTPDPETIYTVFYPQGTVVTQPNPVSNLLPPVQSCQAFTGYHDNVKVAIGDAGAPTNFAYAILPTCSSSLESLTSVVSHEWIEASTDPFPSGTGAFTINGGPDAAFYSVDGDHAVWALLGGGEAGDLCDPEGGAIYVTPTDIGHRVQRTWSNVLAGASHDPCTPSIAGAFFASAPVLSDDVTLTSALTGIVKTKGVVIPVGQTKTIEVDLFSDGDTGGAWSVTADDLLAKYYGSYGLQSTMTFAWDRTQGQNGEKLHLAITVTKAGLLGGGHAFMITSLKGNRRIVWPGLVVEK